MVMCSRSALPLSQLEVLVIDSQATAAAARGHLLEIGWGRVVVKRRAENGRSEMCQRPSGSTSDTAVLWFPSRPRIAEARTPSIKGLLASVYASLETRIASSRLRLK
jgi:hypothetical protein